MSIETFSSTVPYWTSAWVIIARLDNKITNSIVTVYVVPVVIFCNATQNAAKNRSNVIIIIITSATTDITYSSESCLGTFSTYGINSGNCCSRQEKLIKGKYSKVLFCPWMWRFWLVNAGNARPSRRLLTLNELWDHSRYPLVSCLDW